MYPSPPNPGERAPPRAAAPVRRFSSLRDDDPDTVDVLQERVLSTGVPIALG